MNKYLYWRAQWHIGHLEEFRSNNVLGASEEDILDILLALS